METDSFYRMCAELASSGGGGRAGRREAVTFYKDVSCSYLNTPFRSLFSNKPNKWFVVVVIYHQ
jgi:hypothetical protein